MSTNRWRLELPRCHVLNFPDIQKAARERRRALIVPREHGAWGLLLVPFVTGAGVALGHGGRPLPVMLLLVAALALFWLRTPVESLLGTSAMRAQTAEERRAVSIVIAILAAVAALALATLLWAGRNEYLCLIGAFAGTAFGGQALLKRLGRPTRMIAEIVGTVGLTAAAPAAYYVMTQRLDSTAWMLWLANFAFAGDQIHYVQLRIRSARVDGVKKKFTRGWTFALGQLAMIVLVAIACWFKLLPWTVMMAFAPLVFRGYAYFFRRSAPLVVRQLGWNELGQAIGFCVLFIGAFWLAR